MGFPRITIPFQFFNGGHMPDISHRVVNYPVRSKDFPHQPRPNLYNRPWPRSPGDRYRRVMVVVDHLTGTRKRVAVGGQQPVAVPTAEQGYQGQQVYTVPNADMYDQGGDGDYDDGPRPPIPASARRWRW
jgi:hypothetical protein